MKKNLTLFVLLLFGMAVAVSGCAYAVSPVTGGLYTSVKAPIAATNLADSPKKGTAVCKSILGFIALGDCSIDAAAKQGNITKVHHVDYEAMNVIFVYATFTTVVYGE